MCSAWCRVRLVDLALLTTLINGFACKSVGGAAPNDASGGGGGVDGDKGGAGGAGGADVRTGGADGGGDLGAGSPDGRADSGEGGADGPTVLSFALPTKMYLFDARQWQVPAGNAVAVSCGAGQLIADCCNPPAPLSKPDCMAAPLACDVGVCTVHVKLSTGQSIALRQEVPSLAGLAGAPLVGFSLSTWAYAATSTLDVELPPLALYLAPIGVTDPADPSATKVGTMPAIAAGATVGGSITKEPNADATFAAFGQAFGTPFNLIAATTVLVPSGSPTPSGRVSITVTGRAMATIAP
jgi:hypothetical protein